VANDIHNQLTHCCSVLQHEMSADDHQRRLHTEVKARGMILRFCFRCDVCDQATRYDIARVGRHILAASTLTQRYTVDEQPRCKK